jgi:protein-L-isoaspartate O-methyltransferase
MMGLLAAVALLAIAVRTVRVENNNNSNTEEKKSDCNFNDLGKFTGDTKTMATIMEEDEVLFEDFRYHFAPNNPPDPCSWSAGAGVHGFIASRLKDPIINAARHNLGDVCDIGSGMGFLLALFKVYVTSVRETQSKVVGFELDQGAVAKWEEIRSNMATNWDSDWGQEPADFSSDPEIINKNVMDGDAEESHPDKFAVINVGFAAKEIPQEIVNLGAKGATILMPICTADFDKEFCPAKFHLYTIQDDGSVSSTVEGPQLNRFWNYDVKKPPNTD